MKVIQVSGKRKTSIARATLRAGAGIVRINSQLLQNYTPKVYKSKIEEPMLIAGDAVKNVNIDVSVEGGGINTQAEASRLVIARALAAYNNSLQREFLNYDKNLLVADVRRKETHKPNNHGKARARRQFSKR